MSLNVRESSSVPKIIYKPILKETQLTRFQKFVEEKRITKFNGYHDFHAWSVEKFQEFWSDVWEFFDIKCLNPYSQVCSKDTTFENIKWFLGARLNYAENILKYRDSRTAIIATGDHNNERFVTYEQLYEEVRVYVTALRDEGVMKGDVLCCYMSNKIEAVFAFLASVVIGAVWCGVLPLLGTKAVLSRFERVKPKVMFVGGNFFFEGTEIRMDLKIPEIAKNLPSLTKVVYTPSHSAESVEAISDISKGVFVEDFLAKARHKLEGNESDIIFEQVPFDHPITLCFTSGTTGKPKGLVHGNGIILTTLRDYGLHQDITRDDCYLSFSPAGWVSWYMVIGTMHLGSTVCLYEGFPFKGSRFYDIIDKYGITSSYIWSSTVEDMEKNGQIPGNHHSLQTLKQLLPVGSVAKPHSVAFLTQKLKPGIFSNSAYGSTEVFGLLCGPNSNLPVHLGEIQPAALGVDLQIINQEGVAVLGERGDVVLGKPFPGNALRILDDEGGQIFKDLYLNSYPGYFKMSDEGWINPETKGFIIYGRSDETLNPKGARFSCAEIYFALEDLPGIADSVCAAQYNSKLDERVILFIKLQLGYSLTEAFVKYIKKTIEDNMSIEHVPDVILETPDIPYNMTGKKLNGLVKRLINGKPILNVEAVVNPDCLEFYKTVCLEDF